MMRNMRAIAAQVYRGGSRSFSSSGNESKEVVGRSGLEILVEKVSKKNGVGLIPCSVFGSVCYMAIETMEARKHCRRIKEEAKLRSQRRDELLSKMKLDLRGAN